MATEQGSQATRASWSGKWGYILATAGSAVGLGNMWRFPYLAAKYGGGVFLLTYLVLVLTFGVSMVLLEAALGRKTRLSSIGAFKSFGKKYSFIGILASSVPFIILPYYCIIGGWVTKYMSSYIAYSASEIADGGDFFTSFITTRTESFLWMLIFMAIVFIIVALGVDKGIEKANLIMMPALIIMALGVAIFTLTLPGAIDGALYYLIPDFSKFSPELVINALGQMFYSLSIAMCINITYGSYMRKQDSMTQSVTRVAGFDFGVSLLAGFMIVPAAFVAMGSAEAVAGNAGPSLMFIILPNVFNTLSPMVATIVGFVFFLLVLFAAITSAISLMEACVSIVHDGTQLSRKQSVIIVIVFVVAVGFIVNSGYHSLDFIQPLGEGSTILDFMDFISNSVIMPVVAILTCIFVGWLIKPKALIDEIKISSPFRAEKAWVVVIKYIAPVCIAAILISNLLPFLAG